MDNHVFMMQLYEVGYEYGKDNVNTVREVLYVLYRSVYTLLFHLLIT